MEDFFTGWQRSKVRESQRLIGMDIRELELKSPKQQVTCSCGVGSLFHCSKELFMKVIVDVHILTVEKQFWMLDNFKVLLRYAQKWMLTLWHTL